MSVVRAQAPGKVFVIGEYAVLAGAPALVAALDVHASVTLAVAPGPASLAVASTVDGRWSDAGGAPPAGDAAAIAAACSAARAAAPVLADLRVDVNVDSHAFLSGDRKLGLGRSAATLAATVAGLLAAAGVRRADLLPVTLAANARLQGGLGSGADVAAAVHGGVVAVRRSADTLVVRPSALPPGLHLIVGWTREAAPTVPLLERFSAADRPAALAPLVDDAEAAVAAVARGDAATFLAVVDRSTARLEALGAALDLPIVTPTLRRLVETAQHAGATAKPAGAGGGDCGIALARSAAEAEAVRAAWRAAGIVPLDVGIATAGARAVRATAPADEVAVG